MLLKVACNRLKKLRNTDRLTFKSKLEKNSFYKKFFDSARRNLKTLA